MANYNAGIRFNDVVAKYMFLEFDSDTATCTVHLEGNIDGAKIRMKATIYSDMWESEDEPGDDPEDD